MLEKMKLIDDIKNWFNAPWDEWKVRLYWLFGLFALIASCHHLYNKMQRPVAALLLFLAGLLILYYYYVKWFLLSDPMQWGKINPCPDYLTLIDPGNGKDTPAKCVDFIGVSANGTIQKANMSSLPNVPTSSVFSVPPNFVNSRQLQGAICSQVHEKGLVWTGVCPEL